MAAARARRRPLDEAHSDRSVADAQPALNIFLGLVLLLVSVLLLLALATYHPTDSSLNTASGADTPHAVRNWIGLFGAYLSDLLLQSSALPPFCCPYGWAASAGRGCVRAPAARPSCAGWATVLALNLRARGLWPSAVALALAPRVPVEGVMGA